MLTLADFKADSGVIKVRDGDKWLLANAGQSLAYALLIADAEREACAKIAETKAQDYLSPEYATGQPFSSHAERFACKQVAEAIRARR